MREGISSSETDWFNERGCVRISWSCLSSICQKRKTLGGVDVNEGE